MKKTNKNLELMLPVEFVQTPDDYEVGRIGIRVHGNVLGNEKVCEVFYRLNNLKMYSNGDYEQIVNLLKDNKNRMVKVLFKVKGRRVKKFKIDLNSLALNYNDDRLKKLDIAAYSLYDMPSKNNVNVQNIDKEILEDKKRTKLYNDVFLWTIGIMELMLNLLFLITKPYWLLIIFPITAFFVYFLYCNIKL